MPVFEATACFGVYVTAENAEEAHSKLIAEAIRIAPEVSDDIYIIDTEESNDFTEDDFS